jgi:hypothetical protein
MSNHNNYKQIQNALFFQQLHNTYNQYTSHNNFKLKLYIYFFYICNKTIKTNNYDIVEINKVHFQFIHY